MEPPWSETATRTQRALLGARVPDGHWRGELSSSALSTATAVAALSAVLRHGSGVRSVAQDAAQQQIAAGRAWLAAHANDDGGFGDTVDSPANLSTTALAWMALGPAVRAAPEPATGLRDATRSSAPPEPDAVATARGRAEAWMQTQLGGPVTPERLAAALEAIYGRDRTFAVPILTACAIGGAYGEDAAPWRSVRRLPFELAALPQGLFRFLGLPVVSYALPALIAIGQAIQHHRPTRNPLAMGARAATRAKTLDVLERIQPVNGGFLEATPLTSFVVMSLASIGQCEHAVVRRGVEFLADSMRADGSWPIDTDLATWMTSLSVRAIGGSFEGSDAVRDWLLQQQHRERHPYTGAAPGGWAWTDLPGGVPDADDTPGALLALRELEPDEPSRATCEAAQAGLEWLAGLQNRDGGIPTFCRGWGKLPFDQSCADLTAHVLVAADCWRAQVTSPTIERMEARARAYLVRTQSADGAWVPLWFGNQHQAEKRNPVYGTSRVLRAARVAGGNEAWAQAVERGTAWLCAAQNDDGGFGGDRGVRSSIEETGLALEGLAETAAPDDALERGAMYLVGATDGGTRFPAQPIGLYFAQLWYSERLYPVVFAAAAYRALERRRRLRAT